MIGVESVVTKIVFALLKKATAKTAFAVVGKAIEVYSIFDTIHDARNMSERHASDCGKLQTYGLQVLADQVSDRCHRQIAECGRFDIRGTSNLGRYSRGQ